MISDQTLFKTINMRDFLNKFSETDDSVQEDFSSKVYNYIQSNTGSGSSESYLKESYDKMISSEFENESWYVNEKFFTNNSSTGSNTYWPKNWYHKMGKTLVKHIYDIIQTNSDSYVQDKLPEYYNYYQNNKHLYMNPVGNGDIPLYLGYWTIYENINNFKKDEYIESDSEIGISNLKIMPIIPNDGIPIVPQFVKKDIEDSYGNCNLNLIKRYKRYSLNSCKFESGYYDPEDFSDIVKNKLKKVNTQSFDWNKRQWVKSDSYQNDLLGKYESDKHIFDVELDETNDMLHFKQYE